ncbi:MAG: hypothetical protein F6K03_08945, partial [Kamptonema sp. SIO4C4]|nr:hypothetical protein [Kamptonema sp. SIO4C4]
MIQPLANYFQLNRRYARSVNLERDIEQPAAVQGYIFTERSLEALRRILTGIQGKGSPAWTLTSVYGTGKSAFAHYVAALMAPLESEVRKTALSIAEKTLEGSRDYELLVKDIPPQGLVQAVATGAREPIGATILRGVQQGVERFWRYQGKQPPEQITQVLEGVSPEHPQEIIAAIKTLAEVSQTGVFLVVDELGKNLEYAAYQGGTADLYLLQQLAELAQDGQISLYVLGILHQAFGDYSQHLASVQRNEWAKIQGRFEDIPFTESAPQMMRLIAQAIQPQDSTKFSRALHQYAEDWVDCLRETLPGEEVTQELIMGVYPLHPLTALVLPTLCHRYAQNDRSLFTFLTSAEPFSLQRFLQNVPFDIHAFPTLKLDRLYDYFLAATGMGLAYRPHLQRWVEIQDLITDAKHLDEERLRVLKAIAILNLVTTTGVAKATRRLVTLALADNGVTVREDEVHPAIQQLLDQGVIHYRRQIDELRLWQGSDFNVDLELAKSLEGIQTPLAQLLSEFRPLKPVVAQRHSYKTGTLRYFERLYLEQDQDLSQLSCAEMESDGMIGYWLEDNIPADIPAHTADGKPFLLLPLTALNPLRLQAREYVALRQMQQEAPELQTDGVARKEIRYRVGEAEQRLMQTLEQS